MTKNEKPTYNGWSNYETWAVNLWVTNEQSSYTYWSERTREVLVDFEADDDNSGATKMLADELRESIQDECKIEGACLAADLINAALGEVDWVEIATSFVEDFAPSLTCACCCEEILANEKISTFCGDIHSNCLARHLADCDICRADEGLACVDEDD